MKEIIVVLHNIRSVYNVGSIFRTADAAGVKKIYLCGITPEPIDRFGKIRPQFSKVSLGAEKTVTWDGSMRSPRAIAKLLERLRAEGYKIFAVEQSPHSTPYYKYYHYERPFIKIVLVMGNEIKGLPPGILKKADKILEIPMQGAMVWHVSHPYHAGRRKTVRQAHHKESLNVAVAFGIITFGLLYN